MPFRPMPLLDFDKGLFKAREPFIAPKNAFTEMLNCHVLRGRVLKRKGYTQFGQLEVSVADEVIGSSPTQHFNGVSAFVNTPVVPGAQLDDSADTYAINFTNAGSSQDIYGYSDRDYPNTTHLYQTITEPVAALVGAEFAHVPVGANNSRAVWTIDSLGPVQQVTCPYVAGTQYNADLYPLAGDLDATYGSNVYSCGLTPGANGIVLGKFAAVPASATITYHKYVGYVTNATGVYDVTFENPTAGGPNTVLANYRYLPQRPVMGIYDFFDLSGAEYLMACDTKRIWLWNETTERFDDVLGADEWSAAIDENLFQFQGYDDVVYINNGADVPKTYDPDAGTVTDTGTDVDGTSGDVVEAASRFLRHKNRGIYFRPTESSVIQQQRVRFTPVNDIEYAAASATNDYSDLYADAPTEDTIVTADFVGDDIIVVFSRSVWRLRYIGDPYSPYEWERVPSMDGGPARMGIVQLGHSVLFRGTQSMQICDGVTAQPFDFDIPDFTLDWEQTDALYTSGVFLPQERQVFFNYADTGETLPDSILAVQLDDLRRVQSFSEYKTAVGFHCFGTYRESSSPTWDDFGETWDSYDLPWDAYGLSIGAPIILGGDYTGTVYTLADGYSDNGSNIEMSLKTIRLNPFPMQRAHLGYIDIIADAVRNTTITVYVMADYQTTPHTSVSVSLDTSGGAFSSISEKVMRRIPVNKIATFHTIQVWCDNKKPIAIDAITPWFKPAGPIREIA